jgi:hypothetical protein
VEKTSGTWMSYTDKQQILDCIEKEFGVFSHKKMNSKKMSQLLNCIFSTHNGIFRCVFLGHGISEFQMTSLFLIKLHITYTMYY